MSQALRLRQKLLELGVLVLQRLQSFGVGDLQAAVEGEKPDIRSSRPQAVARTVADQLVSRCRSR